MVKLTAGVSSFMMFIYKIHFILEISGFLFPLLVLCYYLRITLAVQKPAVLTLRKRPACISDFVQPSNILFILACIVNKNH